MTTNETPVTPGCAIAITATGIGLVLLLCLGVFWLGMRGTQSSAPAAYDPTNMILSCEQLVREQYAGGAALEFSYLSDQRAQVVEAPAGHVWHGTVTANGIRTASFTCTEKGERVYLEM